MPDAPMPPKIALNNLAAAASQFRGTLAEHQALQESLRTLSELVARVEPEAQSGEQQKAA